MFLGRHTCGDAEIKATKPFSASKINNIEMHKSVPLRFPANNDSVGIVGLCVLDAK